MSSRQRNILTVVLLVFLVAAAFSAGFFANDLIFDNNRSALAQNNDFGVFWEVWDLIEGNFHGRLPQEQVRTYGAIRGSLGTIDDPYTVFIEPAVREVEREELQGTFGGIGAFISRPEDGGDVILEPIPGNPAEAAGILAGDVLKAVDGVAIAAQMTVNEIVDMIKGEKGTAVVLTVLHPEALETEDISVIRDDILIPSVTHRVLDETDIGYIRLSRFSGESAGEVAEAISHLQELGAQRFVLDLRQNRGGLLEAAIAVSDHFLDGGPVLIQESNDDGTRTFEASMTTALPDAPLVVLVDGGSASASEIVAGALHDRGRATMIGSDRTFGKGSVQKVFDLSDGSSVHVTSARWFTPQRTKLDGEGLEPDILVEQTQEALDNGRDEVLNRAIQFLLDEGTAATQ